MGNKLKITESQLKTLVENKNRKIVSEQPEQDRINNEFNLVYKVNGYDDAVILMNKRDRKFGLYSTKGKFILEPDYTESNIDLMGEGDDEKIVTEFTNSNGKKFYVLYKIEMTGVDNPQVDLLSEKQFMELGHEFQSIQPNEEPSTEMRNTDKVYEEGYMDEEMNGPSKEEYFAKHGEDNMGWTGSSNKTYQDLPDGDYDDESYEDFDSLHAAHPKFHKHYAGNMGTDHARKVFDMYKNSRGPLRMKKIRPMDEMGMKEDDMMNESIKGYKTEFERFLKKPKQ